MKLTVLYSRLNLFSSEFDFQPIFSKSCVKKFFHPYISYNILHSRASGHVERFADLMVKDLTSGECFRLDHLIKAALEKQAAAKDAKLEFKEKIADILVKVNINSPSKH